MPPKVILLHTAPCYILVRFHFFHQNAAWTVYFGYESLSVCRRSHLSRLLLKCSANVCLRTTLVPSVAMITTVLMLESSVSEIWCLFPHASGLIAFILTLSSPALIGNNMNENLEICSMEIVARQSGDSYQSQRLPYEQMQHGKLCFCRGVVSLISGEKCECSVPQRTSACPWRYFSFHLVWLFSRAFCCHLLMDFLFKTGS